MGTKKIRVVVLVLALLGALAAGYYFYRNNTSGALTIYGNVDIRTVNLSFRVSGRLASLYVDEGDTVTPGQKLGEIDSQPYINSLRQATATVMARGANLSLLETGYREEETAQVRSEVKERQAAYDYSEKLYQRRLNLWSSRAVSTNDLEDARKSRDQARAALQASRDKLKQYESGYRAQEIENARANLRQSEASQAQSELDLADTILTAPSAGTVLTRAVEPGTMLAAGASVLTVSLTRPVWVRAYVDEANLYHSTPGTKVELFVDGRPNKPYEGTVGFVSPTAEFTPKTVQTPELRTDLVYRLRIIVDNPDDGLRQGMPVTVKFP